MHLFLFMRLDFMRLDKIADMRFYRIIIYTIVFWLVFVFRPNKND